MTFNEKFRIRTKNLALGVIRWYHQIPEKDEVIWVLGRQLIKSISSVAANFRAACRARSQAEFYAKMCIVVEEADESLFRLECFQELEWIDASGLDEWYKECQEIVAVMAKTKKNFQSNTK